MTASSQAATMAAQSSSFDTTPSCQVAAAWGFSRRVTGLVPGVLGNDESAGQESFADGLLEHPQFTRPSDFRGWKVPGVLLSGDHAAIARWRREQAERRTRDRRPDLLGLPLPDEGS